MTDSEAVSSDAGQIDEPTAKTSDRLISDSSAASRQLAARSTDPPLDGRAPRFANDSEREFAAILDFYRIRWLYEPRTFPLEWDAAGRPTTSFAPDFYLLEMDLFIELTVLKQSLVTKKNRKLRRLRELYPDVNIKLFYGRDFRSLMTKYGLNRGPAPDPAATPGVEHGEK
jgi:hypothetical protein